MHKTILHIDFDSFFASVEQQFHPEFRGRPLGVTAANGRTAIIAASREAKKAGLKNVMRSYDAFRICPDLRLIRADFNKYWNVSKKFIDICKDYSPFIEVFSMDELFMDITATAHLFGGVDALIDRIKKRIATEIGECITVSIGISHNKLLAKLASGLQKPNGIVRITPENLSSVYKKAQLTDICGIGSRIEARLQSMGVFTLSQLSNVPLDFLIAEFGNVEGHFLKNVGLGIDRSPVIPYTEKPSVKSVGRNYCLAENEYDKRIVLQNICELSEEIGIKLRRLGKKARTVGLYLRGTHDIHGRKTFSTYMDDGMDIFKATMLSIQNLLPEGYVRQICVWSANLSDKERVPEMLFAKRRDKLVTTIDTLNEKYGDHTIRNGFLLYAAKLTTVPNGFMGDTYERTKLFESGKNL